MPKTILIIEDESSIADTILYALKTEGFEGLWKTLGTDGIAMLKSVAVDLVILDIGLPDINGFEICKQIRDFSNIPIIFLTARTEEIDRIVGLEIGGDDYVIKPFSPRELVARIKTILKRTQVNKIPAHKQESIFTLNEHQAQIDYFNKALVLTRAEYQILKTMLKQPKRVFSREQLMDSMWESPSPSMERTVDSHIKSIRTKLRAVNPGLDPIKTHRGLGYSLQNSA